MKSEKSKLVDCFAGINYVDDNFFKHSVPVNEHVLDRKSTTIDLPQEANLPKIDIYSLSKESLVYVLTADENQMNQIRDQILSKFSIYNNQTSFRLIETQSANHGIIQEFRCKIFN